MFVRHVFINHNFTAMSIGGIGFGDHVRIGPHVTIVTDNHDLMNRWVLKCRKALSKTTYGSVSPGLAVLMTARRFFIPEV